MGIDETKCIQCRLCEKDCVAMCYFWNDQKKVMKFSNENQTCLECGHCIAVCPKDAIVYEKMGNPVQEFSKDGKQLSKPTFESLNHMLQGKRSIRHYKSNPLSSEDINKVLLALSYGPTGANARDLKCRVLSDPTVIKSLSDTVVETLLSSPDLTDLYKTYLLHNQKIGRDSIFFKAPNVIIIHGEPEMNITNSTIAITYGMLAAESLGLGSCWIGLAYMALLANKKAREIANISDKVYGVFVLGHPDIKFARSAPRHPLPLD